MVNKVYVERLVRVYEENKPQFKGIKICVKSGREFGAGTWDIMCQKAQIPPTEREGRIKSEFRNAMFDKYPDIMPEAVRKCRENYSSVKEGPIEALMKVMKQDYQNRLGNGELHRDIRWAIKGEADLTVGHGWGNLNRAAGQNSDYNYIKPFVAAMCKEWPDLEPGREIRPRPEKVVQLKWESIADKAISVLVGRGGVATDLRKHVRKDLATSGTISQETYGGLMRLCHSTLHRDRKDANRRIFITHYIAIKLQTGVHNLKYLNEVLVHNYANLHYPNDYRGAKAVFLNSGNKEPLQYLPKDKPKYVDVIPDQHKALKEHIVASTELENAMNKALKKGPIVFDTTGMSQIKDKLGKALATLDAGALEGGLFDSAFPDLTGVDKLTYRSVDYRKLEERVTKHFNLSASLFTTIPKEGSNKMYDTSKGVKSLKEIFGRVVGEDTGTETLMQMIRTGKADIEALSDLADTGKTITCRIATIQSGVDALVKELNRKGRC